MPVHPELASADLAVPRLVHDTLVHLVRRPGALVGVRVAAPQAWDADALREAMVEAYAARGLHGVEVTVLPTSGEPRLLSVVTEDGA